jgi:PAS domain S-box-containing protein
MTKPYLPAKFKVSATRRRPGSRSSARGAAPVGRHHALFWIEHDPPADERSRQNKGRLRRALRRGRPVEFMNKLDRGQISGVVLETGKRLDAASQRLLNLLARFLTSPDMQESKARLEQAQRVAHVGYWVWDLDVDRVTWSDEASRIYGLESNDGPIDLTLISELIHPEDRESVFAVAEKAILTGARADTEHRLIRPNGEVRTVQSKGEIKKDASGRPYQMFGTVQDITERKKAEKDLHRTQFYLTEGQRLAHMGSWAFDEAGHYWSDELYKIYGLDPKNGAPTVEQYLALVHPHDREAMAETIRRMQEEHRGFDQIERIFRPDGQMRYVRAVAVPVNEEGVFRGFVGTTIDVTEQELLTQELRREQAYLAEAQSLAHIGSWATNLDTKIQHHLSDEIYRLHGLDPRNGPLPFERFFATVHPEDVQGVVTVLANAIRARSDFDHEYRICPSENVVRFVRAIGHHDRAEGIGEYVGITVDITERKRAEEERERLRQFEADLAHINRLNMMGELAAALAHEIKQPIAASITSADACLRWLAQDPPNLERARAAVTRIKQDGSRAADVIDSLRSFYKKSPTAERQLIDINVIIREIIVLLREEAIRCSVTIRQELETGMPNVRADRVQLQQVFMNLMLNAIEAMEGTGGELKIKSGVNAEGQTLISISDTGVGLPADNIERIFDAFHSTKPQGTGMGLAITRSIVESYGGRVWAAANRGPGATFHFTLPCRAEAQI